MSGCNQIREVFGDNHDIISKLTIIEGEGEHKMVRMANLAIIGSHKVHTRFATRTSHWPLTCSLVR